VNPTKIDTIRALYAYSIAAAIILGGGLTITFVPDLDANTKLVVAGFMGSAITFVFGQETATRTARQQASATLAAGPIAQSNGNGGSH
jgi:hypothetical protein